MSSSNPRCAGFKAHSINPQRCRRCFKDLSEHRDDGESGSSNGSTKSFPTARTTIKFQRSQSLKLDGPISRINNDDNDDQNDVSPSVSYTLKPKKVKFTDNDGDHLSSSAAAGQVEPPVEVAFTVCVNPKKIVKDDDGDGSSNTKSNNEHHDYQARIKELSQELNKSKDKIDLLEMKNKELENMRKTFSKAETNQDSIKRNIDEQIKLQKRIESLEAENKSLKNDNKTLETTTNSKIFGRGTLQQQSSKTSNTNTSNSKEEEIRELRNKLLQSEKYIAELTMENEEIKKDVKELEVEFQELHDNFREDQSSEFLVIKHELETMSKNCRVMQFKLKKSERTIEQLESEKLDMQKQITDLYETGKMDVDKRKMKDLENELNIAKEVSLKLHAEIEQLKEERAMAIDGQLQQPDGQSLISGDKMNKMPADQRKQHLAKLSPSPSLDQTNKDYEQVVRDLYDTMEREKDLQEQLKFSEEETRTMRKKLSTMEQENEILMLQIRKMTLKNNQPKDDDDESDELNPEEMKLHLELYEQEMIVLRRKTDELEQENENFQQEIKYLQEKLVSQPITKVEIPELPAGAPHNVIYDHKIKILETEARELRKKLVDKEKENESLRTEVEVHRRRASKVITRSRSMDSEGQSLDMKKQLQLFEQEANILRQKMIALENENEKLSNENKRLQLRISKKPPPGPADQLQMENIELKDKIRELERKCDSLKTDLMNIKLNETTTETETDFIGNLKKQLRLKDADLANQQSRITKMDIEMAKINREYKKLKDSLNPRRRVNRVIRETATRLELKEIIKEMDDEAEHFQENLRGKEAIIENLTEELSELKRTIQEVEQQQKQNSIEANASTKNGGGGAAAESNELKKKLEEEKHRSKTLQEKLDKLSSRTTAAAVVGSTNLGADPARTNDGGFGAKNDHHHSNFNDNIEELKRNLDKYKQDVKELNDKLNISMKNNDELNKCNKRLNETIELNQKQINELNKKLGINEKLQQELRENLKNTKQELVEKSQSSMVGGDWQQSAPSALQRECQDLKRKLDESRSTIQDLRQQMDKQREEFQAKECKTREEFNQKVEQTSKNVRKEVHLELQTLREECTTQKNRCQEYQVKLDKAEKDLKELMEKLKTNQTQVRREQNEMVEKIRDLENQVKSEQRRREKLEKELEMAGRGKEEEVLKAQERIIQLEREIRRHQAKMDDLEYDYSNRINSSEKELNKLKQDYDDLTNKYDLLEKDYVDLKSRSVSEKEALAEAVQSLKKSYEDKLDEIKMLKESLLSQRKEWYKEKLGFQERIADLESKLNKANLVVEERNRLKLLVEEKENLLNSYRKEERQHNEDREKNRIRIDTMQNRIVELERVERNTRFMSITGRAQVDKELQDYRIRLEHSETSHKGELAALHAEYEGRMRLLGEEVEHLQQQMAHLAQERDKYRDLYEKNSKDRASFRGTFKDEIEDLQSQLRIVRTDLEGAMLENRNLKIQHGTEKSTWQIQLAQYKVQINQLEERILLETTRGSTRNYARTKMELAWEKERQENLRLLQDTQKFIQELRDKLLSMESLREKERDEARRQLLELKTNMDNEHVDTQQKLSELQFDLLALKEVYTRIKSQNERYKRERTTMDRAKMDFLDNEMAELRKITEMVQQQQQQQNGPKTGINKTNVATMKQFQNHGTTNNDDNKNTAGGGVGGAMMVITDAINQLQQRLQSRYNDLIQEARSSSLLSVQSNLNGRFNTGSNTSLSSNTNLPPPSSIKRAPPRSLKLAKKSLSLDQQQLQQQSQSQSRGCSQDRIWDSDHSLNSTPNSSISNLRAGSSARFGYAGYESDSSGSNFFPPSAGNVLRLRQGFLKDSSLAGSDSDTSAISSADTASKKTSYTLKDRFRIKRSSKQDDDGGGGKLAALQGFERSPIELAKQREKKEKSLRYKISKTLSKTFSRSASVLSEASIPEHTTKLSGQTSASPSSSSTTRTRTKSPTRSKSPEIKKLHQEPMSGTRGGSSSAATAAADIIPGIAQLNKRPTQSNLAIPPSTRTPITTPKIKLLRTETNV